MAEVHLAGAAMASGVALNATASVRSYMSPQHKWASAHLARLAADYERDHAGEKGIRIRHRTYVMSAMMESIAYLEAFINEIFEDAFDGGGSATEGLAPQTFATMAAYWRGTKRGRGSTLDKYAEARLAAGIVDRGTGRRPHQDVQAAIALRDWMTHYRPQTISDSDVVKAIADVSTRFAPNPFLDPPEGNWSPHHALSAGCASWASESVRAFVLEFADAVGCTTSLLDIAWEEEP